MPLARQVPWWAKLGLKLALSRAPVSYDIWKRIGIFRHGDMTDPVRAISVFRSHIERVRSLKELPCPFSMLELGPGDSILSAGVAKSLGASQSILVDVGDFADRNPKLFEALDSALSAAGMERLFLGENLDLERILESLNARYFTNGLASLAEIPDGSIDLIWSSVVLEHVLLDEFDQLAAECARILSPKGVMSHSVDLRDHLGGGLNNLRFSPHRWESPSWRNAGFYTNRMSQQEILAAFERQGFRTERLKTHRWPAPPIDRAKIHPNFRTREDKELAVAEFEVVMVKGDA